MQTSVEKVRSGDAMTGTRMFSGKASLIFEEKDCKELNSADGNRPGIRINNEWLYPDESTAYVEFKLCYSWPSISAYRVAAHPQTVARNYLSMRNKVFNEGHKMRSYDADKEKKNIPRDRILGCVVAVELLNAPGGSALPTSVERAPHIRAVAAIFKNAERVPSILGEHQSGRHVWTVSQETDYSLLDSGFVLAGEPQNKSVRELVERTTPPEFRAQKDLWYVPTVEAPDGLIDTYSFEQRRIVADYEGMSAVVLKGGLGGKIHYGGVGMVKYGAEKAAEIEKLLAHDPDRIQDEDGLLKLPEAAAWLDAMKDFQKNSENVLTALASAVLPRSLND